MYMTTPYWRGSICTGSAHLPLPFRFFPRKGAVPAQGLWRRAAGPLEALWVPGSGTAVVKSLAAGCGGIPGGPPGGGAKKRAVE